MDTISDLVLKADQFEDESRTPFASTPWLPSSEVLWNDGSDTTPIQKDGRTFEYFLEPLIIKEVTEGLPSLGPEALIVRVIRYAKADA